MGRKRNESEDRIQTLEQIIRELKSINRQLTKRLRKNNIEIHEEENETFIETEINTKKCKRCSKGTIEEVYLGPKKFRKCSVCDLWEKN